MPDLISKATRNRFREALVDSVLRHIEMIFDEAGLTPDLGFDPGLGGARRTLVEQYYANTDFESRTDVAKILTAYAEVILWLRKIGNDDVAYDLITRMANDGFEYADGSVTRRWTDHAPLASDVRVYATMRSLPEPNAQIDRLLGSIDDDPSLAVGTAKELVETVCKTILDERNIVVGDEDMGKIIRAVTQELRLDPSSVSQNRKGSETIRRTLANLGQVAQGIAELRNLYGTGHGRAGRTSAIKPRHARLAVGAATTLALFLLETHVEQTEGATPVSSSTD